MVFQNIPTTTVRLPKRARESPENRIPFKALERCMSFPAEVLRLVRLITKKIKAVMAHIPLTAVPTPLKVLKIALNSDADGACAREGTDPPEMEMEDA